MNTSEDTISTPIPPRHSGIRFLKRGVRIGIVLGVVAAWGWFLIKQIDTLQGYEWQFAPFSFLIGIFFAALYFGGLAFGWTLLLIYRVQKPAAIPIRKGMYIWLLSMVTRYVPGNIWHILSRVALAERLNASKADVLASSTIEQILVLLGTLVLFVITLPKWTIIPNDTEFGPIIPFILIALPLALLILHPRIFGHILTWMSVRFNQPVLAWEYTYRGLLLILSIYAVANAFAGLSLVVILSGLTTPSLQDVPLIIGSAALAWTIGYLSFLTPSGLGVREGVLTALLAQIYPLPVAIVASLLFRVVSTLGELLAILMVWTHSKLSLPDGPPTHDSL